MKPVTYVTNNLLSLSLATALLTGCAAAPKSPDGASNVRQQLTQLQADVQLAVLAPLAIKDAEQAVLLAEQPEKNTALAAHRVVMAERKVSMASTQAQTRQLELQRDALSQKRDDVRLSARTREAASARADASSARSDAEFARSQASDARADASSARLAESAAAGRETAALSAATTARQQAAVSAATTADLRAQIAELNARPTDRGLVVTLGDVLFDTGRANLKNGSSNHLNKLALFLNAYPERTAQIEGHTDDVGSDAANMLLSQRRADTVKAFLVQQGIAASRLDASGKGEAQPLVANVAAEARAQNRRVEVIIANTLE
ncbi:OmpA family protein [Rheinheimera maricola]|uniref:OmpA family protein n=1 Tax=Rheinheimera maricola TaxID=2793282 RepID=A0ABS7XF23_9GAMM|nr:OmpA family protein [Rheinheimera maricola]MBZ9613332.1 OmpA family protein [Rheinheimera maricola]